MDFPGGGGVGDIAADDLVFMDQQGGIDRVCGVGVILDLVDVPHDGFSGVGGQVEALFLLQGGVAVDDAKVTDIKATFPVADFADGIIIRRGKKAFKKVVIK